jgi:O-methyltransferase
MAEASKVVMQSVSDRQPGEQRLAQLEERLTQLESTLAADSGQLEELGIRLEQIIVESQNQFAHLNGLIESARNQLDQLVPLLGNASAELRGGLEQVLAESKNQFAHLNGLVENARNQLAQHISEQRSPLVGQVQDLQSGPVDFRVGPPRAEETEALADPLFSLELRVPVRFEASIEDFCDGIAAFARTKLDERQRFLLAERLAHAAYPTYKFVEFGRIYFNDREFIEQYKMTMDPGNWHSLDRKYIVRELLKLNAHVPGDYVECGVYKGATAYLLAQAADRRGSLVHLFDSWEGLSAPGIEDGTHWVEGQFKVSEALAKEHLSLFDCCRFYKGWIPDRFSEVADIQIAFLHIDLDLLTPTLQTLQFFYPRVVPGGQIVSDDYGSAACPGVKQAMDAFFADKPEAIASLPSGQGLVIKR